MLETFRVEDFPGTFILPGFVHEGWGDFSLEMYLETESSAQSYIFHMDSSMEKDFNCRLLVKKKHHFG